MIGSRLAPFIATARFFWRHNFKVATVVLGAGFAILGSYVFLGFGLSDVPVWAWVFIGTGAVGTMVGTFAAAFIVATIYDPSGVQLHEVDPVDGDAAAHLLSEERFEDLLVVDSQGREVDKNRLHTINTWFAPGYEVKRYNPDTNVAQLSVQAELSAVELRRDRQAIEALEDQYDEVVDNLVEVRARHQHATREAVKDSVMEVLTILEGIETPAGDNFVTDIVRRKSDEARIDEMATIEDVAGELDYDPGHTHDMDDLTRDTGGDNDV